MTKRTLVFSDKKGQVTDVTLYGKVITISVSGDLVAKLPLADMWEAIRDYLAETSFHQTAVKLRDLKQQAKRAIGSTHSGNLAKPIGKKNIRMFRTDNMSSKEED